MDYNKRPIDFPQQIETLRAKGMHVEDEAVALNQLEGCGGEEESSCEMRAEGTYFFCRMKRISAKPRCW